MTLFANVFYVLAIVRVANAACLTVGTTTTCSFNANGGTAESFTKPAGVSTLSYSITGGQGGGKLLAGTYYASGPSASLSGNLDFTATGLANAEVVLSATVGAAGAITSAFPRAVGGTGYRPGGQGGRNINSSGYNGGGGGGSTAITTTDGTILALAAGGAGFGNNNDHSAPPQPGSNANDLSSVLTSSETFPGVNGTDTSNADPAGIFASGGGGAGVPGGSSPPQSRGNYGRSYYNSIYHVSAPTLTGTPAMANGIGTNGTIVVVFETPAAPSTGNGRLRARKLRRHSCPVGYAMCEYGPSATCIELATSLEHCGACFNDCADLADSTSCIHGVCKRQTMGSD